MTKSAENDPEVQRLLKRCEELGCSIPLPEKWGAKRAKNILKMLISIKTPGICPVCGQELKKPQSAE